jgi:hypothetical protein
MDGRLFDELLPSTGVGTIALSLGIVFLLIQQRTMATIGLAGAWICAGCAFITVPPGSPDVVLRDTARMKGLGTAVPIFELLPASGT